MKWVILIGLLVGIMLVGGWMFQTSAILALLLPHHYSPQQITNLTLSKLHQLALQGKIPMDLYNYTLYYHLLHPNDAIFLKYDSPNDPHPLIQAYNSTTGKLTTFFSGKFFEKIGKNKIRMVAFFYNGSYFTFTVNSTINASGIDYGFRPPVEDYVGKVNVTKEISPRYYWAKFSIGYCVVQDLNKEDWKVAEQIARELRHYQEVFHWSNKTVVDFLTRELTPFILHYDYNSTFLPKKFKIYALDGDKISRIEITSHSDMKSIVFYGKGVCCHYSFFNAMVLTKMGFDAYEMGVFARSGNKLDGHCILAVNASQLHVKPNVYVEFTKKYVYYYKLKGDTWYVYKKAFTLNPPLKMGLYVYDIYGGLPTEMLGNDSILYNAYLKHRMSLTKCVENNPRWPWKPNGELNLNLAPALSNNN